MACNSINPATKILNSPEHILTFFTLYPEPYYFLSRAPTWTISIRFSKVASHRHHRTEDDDVRPEEGGQTVHPEAAREVNHCTFAH